MADALRNAEKGSWLRLACPASFVTDGEGNVVVNHSIDEPPFRTTSPYGGLTMEKGKGTISQVRAFHETQMDAAIGILRAFFFTMRGGAGSDELRRKYGT